MKKVFVVLSLMLFTGSLSSNVFAAANGYKTEIGKQDDKKKRKKGKKAGCCKAKTGDEKEKCCAKGAEEKK